jgi:heat shock protein HslJ
MNRKKTLLATLVTTALMLVSVGCLSLGAGGGTDLNGTAWQLETYAGEQPLAGTEFTARFEDTQIQGNAGCNQYFGTYRLENGQLTITDLAWTEMACLDPEGVMEQEQNLLNLLGNAQTYQVEDGTLQITTADGERLVFSKTSNP